MSNFNITDATIQALNEGEERITDWQSVLEFLQYLQSDEQKEYLWQNWEDIEELAVYDDQFWNIYNKSDITGVGEATILNELIEYVQKQLNNKVTESKNEMGVTDAVNKAFKEANGRVPDTIEFNGKVYKRRSLLTTDPSYGKCMYYIGDNFPEGVEEYFTVKYSYATKIKYTDDVDKVLEIES